MFEHYERAMTGSEIARDMGISRQAVSQTLKRAMGKMYRGVMDNGLEETPTEAVLFLQKFLNVTDEEDIQQFFELFPTDIQNEIKEDAEKRFRRSPEGDNA